MNSVFRSSKQAEHPGNATWSAKDVEWLISCLPPFKPGNDGGVKSDMIGGCRRPRRNVNPFVLLHRGGWKPNAPLLFFFFPPSFLQWQQQEPAGRCGGKLPPVREGFPCKSAVRTTTEQHHHHHVGNKHNSRQCAWGSHQYESPGREEKTHTIHNGVAWGCRDSSQTNPGETRSVCLLDSCRANGNMHGASCARLQPMEKSEMVSSTGS